MIMIITMITVMLRQFIVYDTGGLASSLLFTPGPVALPKNMTSNIDTFSFSDTYIVEEDSISDV